MSSQSSVLVPEQQMRIKYEVATSWEDVAEVVLAWTNTAVLISREALLHGGLPCPQKTVGCAVWSSRYLGYMTVSPNQDLFGFKLTPPSLVLCSGFCGGTGKEAWHWWQHFYNCILNLKQNYVFASVFLDEWAQRMASGNFMTSMPWLSYNFQCLIGGG